MSWKSRCAGVVAGVAVVFAASAGAPSSAEAQDGAIAAAAALSRQMEQTEWDQLREQLGLSPRVALQRLSSAVTRTLGPGAIEAAAAGVATTPPPNIDPGNAYCFLSQSELGNLERGIHRAWPARSSHEYTLTIPLFVYATSLDFTDATVDGRVGVLQAGTDFYSFSLSTGVVSGPLPYDDAHASFVWVEGTAYSIAVNAVYYLNGKRVTGPEYFVLEATGPNAIGGPVCRLM